MRFSKSKHNAYKIMSEMWKKSSGANPAKLNPITREVIIEKANELNAFYKEIVGLAELEKYQKRVTEFQNKLSTAQERRRKTGYELTEIRKRSNELQDQLHKMKRQDNLQRYLDLMGEETETLKAEQEIMIQFNHQDHEEREIFTLLTNAIRDSHEKQQMRLESMKYIGVFFTLIGSAVAYLFTSLRSMDMKFVVQSEMQSNNKNLLERLDEIVSQPVATVNNPVATVNNKDLITEVQMSNNKVLQKLDELIKLQTSIEGDKENVGSIKKYLGHKIDNLQPVVHESGFLSTKGWIFLGAGASAILLFVLNGGH